MYSIQVTMRYYTVIVLFQLAVTIYAKPSPRIIGGSDAAEGQYPYQVMLNRGGIFTCGGSIISDRCILTAAHCLSRAQPKDMTITAAAIKRIRGNGTTYTVEAIKIHENYTDPRVAGPDNDIAILRLSKDIVFGKNVQKINLPEDDFNTFDDATVILTGWGALRIGGKIPITLQQIPLKVISNRECNETWTAFREEPIISSKICTTSKVAQGACHGDSGGPLALGNTQVGVVSYGWPCGTGVPDVFTRVSSYVGWIKKNCGI